MSLSPKTPESLCAGVHPSAALDSVTGSKLCEPSPALPSLDLSCHPYAESVPSLGAATRIRGVS